MPGTFFTSVGAFNNEDIDNIFEPRQAQFPATPPTGLLDNGTDISELYAPVSVGSPAALTGYLVNGVDIANIFAVAGSVALDYTATPAAGTVNEGASLTINVAGTNTPAATLYWTINHGTTASADFSANSGSFVFNGTAGSFSITTVADATTEGNQTFTVQIRTGSTGGPVIATTSTITLVDTSQGSFTLGGPTSMNEGVTENFPFGGAGIPQQTYYWRIEHGTTAAADFTAPLSGSFSYVGSPVNIAVTTVADATTEGNQTFTLAVYEDVGYTTLAINKAITVVDTSTTPAVPTYSIAEAASSVNEGSSITFNVTTTNVADGTTLYWSTQVMSGTVNAADFTGGQLTGSVVINSNTASIVRGIVADATTEGSESFRLQLRTGSVGGTIVSTSGTVTINDTSTTPAPTYDIVGAPTPVNEGAAVTFTITTTNVANGTILYWTTTGTGVTGADFTDGLTSGSVTINSNTGSVVRTLENDLTAEGVETFQLQLRTGSVGGTIVDTSNTITVNDTSSISATLTTRTVAGGTTEPNTAYAKWRISTDGNVYTGLTSAAPATQRETWRVSGVNGDFEVFFSPVSGIVPSGKNINITYNTWLPMSVDRTLGLARTPLGSDTGVIEVSIRPTGGGADLAVANITLQVTVDEQPL